MTSPTPDRHAAFLFADAGDWTRAVPAARKALAADPEDPAAHALLALGLAAQKESGEAVASGQRAVALDPEMPFAHYALAQALLEHDEVAAAERSIREALRLEPSADGFAVLAQVRTRQRRWREALDATEEGLALEPEHAASLNFRALALSFLGQKERAESTVEEALGVGPENSFSHSMQGILLLQQSRHAEAVERFKTALRLDPSNEQARWGLIEALKARNGLYRWLLKFTFWTAGLTSQARWFVIIGLFVGFRIVRSVLNANPTWWPVLGPLIALYLLFVLTTWIAEPLSNLLLRLHPLGRLVLRPDQILASTLVGTCLVVAAIAGLVLLYTGSGSAGILATASVLMAIPIGGAYATYNTRGWPMMRGIMVLMGACAAGAVVANLVGAAFASGILLIVFFLGVFTFGWIANYVQMKYE